MSRQSIINSVDNSIKELCRQFRSHPTFFYTENDIVCYFFNILQRELPIARDKNGCKHSLIHREYPTPFRCDMGNNEFKIKGENARTKKDRKYRRGHYDVVVLNPDFIKQHPYEVIKAQNYELYKKEVIWKINRCKPVILYCLEFMYSRDSLESKRGKPKKGTITNFIEKIDQDTKKLVDTQKKYRGFVSHVKTIVLVRESSDKIRDLLKKEVSKLRFGSRVLLCFGE